jgi:hypothetical protein
MFLVFEILRSTPSTWQNGIMGTTKKKFGGASTSKEKAEEPEGVDEGDEEEYSDDATRARSGKRPAYEQEDDDSFIGGGEEDREYSTPDEDLENSADEFAEAITDGWYIDGSGWNPKEKNAKASSMWGLLSKFVRGLIHTHCDLRNDFHANAPGIETIMHIVQNHPSFSKLGGVNCHPDCPKEYATYTRNLCLESGLHTTILERLRNYRRAAKTREKAKEKRKAKKIEKDFERAKKQDSKAKLSDKDRKFMTSFKEEADVTARAKLLKKDKSAEKIYLAQRRVQIDKVDSHTQRYLVCALIRGCDLHRQNL